jgi:hypothetical protein
MNNALTIIEQGSLVTMNIKGKQGTFARAIAFASRDVRAKMGQAMYAKWLENGQYRPVVNDILTCGLVAKAALPYVEGLVPVNGGVSKEQLIGLCRAVLNAVQKNVLDKGKEVKGEKAFVFNIVQRIVEAEEVVTFENEASHLRRAA